MNKSKILVTGAMSGLGSEIFDVLTKKHEVYGYDIVNGKDVLKPDINFLNGRLDVLINCAGINEIDYIENFTETDWDRVLDTNTKGIFMMVKACLPLLKKCEGTILNIISDAAHRPMTGSLAYNASKAAAHIMTRQLAHELTKSCGITVFGVAPNKLEGTKMSKYIDERVSITRGWSPEMVTEYQKQGLVTGQETPPEVVAEFIGYLLTNKENHKYLSGCILEYGR